MEMIGAGCKNCVAGLVLCSIDYVRCPVCKGKPKKEADDGKR
jgi:hypothetical protein